MKFKLENIAGILFVLAKIDDIDGYMIVDTGSEVCTINSTYFESNNKSKTVVTFNGESFTNSNVNEEIKDINIEGTIFKNIDVMNLDLTYVEVPISTVKEIKLLGTLGYNFFKDKTLEINYKENYFKMYKDDNTYELAFKCNVPLVEITCNDKNYNFVLDTGASHNLSELKLTNVTINNEVIDIDFLEHDMKLLSSKFDYEVDGIIGYQLLNNYIVKFNYRTKTISLCKQDNSSKFN